MATTRAGLDLEIKTFYKDSKNQAHDKTDIYKEGSTRCLKSQVQNPALQLI